MRTVQGKGRGLTCVDNTSCYCCLALLHGATYKCVVIGLNYHHASSMELGHLLTRSGLTYPEVCSKVYHDSFCQLDSSVSLPWVICFEAFYLHAGPEAKGSNPTTGLTPFWAR